MVEKFGEQPKELPVSKTLNPINKLIDLYEPSCQLTVVRRSLCGIGIEKEDMTLPTTNPYTEVLDGIHRIAGRIIVRKTLNLVKEKFGDKRGEHQMVNKRCAESSRSSRG